MAKQNYKAQIKDLVTKRKTAADAAGVIIAKAATENRSLTGLEREELQKRHTDIDAWAGDIEVLEKQAEIDRELDEPVTDQRMAGLEDTATEKRRMTKTEMEDFTVQHAELQSLEFRRYLSGAPGLGSAFALEQGDIMPTKLERRRVELRSMLGDACKTAIVPLGQEEQRALETATGPSVAPTGTTGASLVPQGFVNKLEVAMKWYGGAVDAADYLDTESGNILPYPTMDDTANAGEQRDENSVVRGSDGSGAAAEVDPTFGQVTLNAYMFDSGFIRVPVQLMQDSAFNPEAFLQESMGIRLGRKLNLVATTGTGSSQPQGCVTGAVIANTSTLGHPTDFTYTDLITLKYSVNKAYRNKPKTGWMFSDTSMKVLRLMVDGSQRPLFIAGGQSEGIQNKEPDRLDGDPYWINNDMATPAASSKSVLYGDFSKLLIRRVRQVQVARFDQLFMAKLQLGFLAFQRYDSRVLNAGGNPIKYMLQSAS